MPGHGGARHGVPSNGSACNCGRMHLRGLTTQASPRSVRQSAVVAVWPIGTCYVDSTPRRAPPFVRRHEHQCQYWWQCHDRWRCQLQCQCQRQCQCRRQGQRQGQCQRSPVDDATRRLYGVPEPVPVSESVPAPVPAFGIAPAIRSQPFPVHHSDLPKSECVVRASCALVARPGCGFDQLAPCVHEAPFELPQ